MTFVFISKTALWPYALLVFSTKSNQVGSQETLTFSYYPKLYMHFHIILQTWLSLFILGISLVAEFKYFPWRVKIFRNLYCNTKVFFRKSTMVWIQLITCNLTADTGRYWFGGKLENQPNKRHERYGCNSFDKKGILSKN